MGDNHGNINSYNSRQWRRVNFDPVQNRYTQALTSASFVTTSILFLAAPYFAQFGPFSRCVK